MDAPELIGRFGNRIWPCASTVCTDGKARGQDINIANAVAIDGGLITPVMQNTNEMDIISIGSEVSTPFRCRANREQLERFSFEGFHLQAEARIWS